MSSDSFGNVAALERHRRDWHLVRVSHIHGQLHSDRVLVEDGGEQLFTFGPIENRREQATDYRLRFRREDFTCFAAFPLLAQALLELALALIDLLRVASLGTFGSSSSTVLCSST